MKKKRGKGGGREDDEIIAKKGTKGRIGRTQSNNEQ